MALFPAGDIEADDLRTWHITFNQQSWFLYALQGAFALMATESNWDEYGDATADFAADIARNMMLTFEQGVAMIGVILQFAGTTANIPSNGLYCDGASVERSAYPDLFAAIGTNWGALDGTHFNLPDLRGRAAIGAGSGSGLTPRALASTTGEEEHILVGAEMPRHTHTDLGHSHAINQFLPTAAGLEVTLASLDTGLPISATATGFANLNDAGLDEPHNNMQPSVALNYYIVATT